MPPRGFKSLTIKEELINKALQICKEELKIDLSPQLCLEYIINNYVELRQKPKQHYSNLQ